MALLTLWILSSSRCDFLFSVKNCLETCNISILIVTYMNHFGVFFFFFFFLVLFCFCCFVLRFGMTDGYFKMWTFFAIYVYFTDSFIIVDNLLCNLKQFFIVSQEVYR